MLHRIFAPLPTKSMRFLNAPPSPARLRLTAEELKSCSALFHCLFSCLTFLIYSTVNSIGVTDLFEISSRRFILAYDALVLLSKLPMLSMLFKPLIPHLIPQLISNVDSTVDINFGSKFKRTKIVKNSIEISVYFRS